VKPLVSYPLWAAAALVSASLALSLANQATAQGYDGLFAAPPANNTRDDAKKPPAGYDGLFAPKGATRLNPAEAPGYEGLVPGKVAKPPEQQATQRPEQTPIPPKQPTTVVAKDAGKKPAYKFTPPRVVEMSPRPGASRNQPITSAEQLEQLAASHGVRLEIAKMTPEMEANIKVSPKAYSLGSSPQVRVDGMLSAELMVKKQIDLVMKSLNLPNITPAQRQRNARAGYERLLKLADIYRYKANMPDGLYQKMGVPAIFVQEQKEANTKALARLQSAFEVLRPLQ